MEAAGEGADSNHVTRRRKMVETQYWSLECHRINHLFSGGTILIIKMMQRLIFATFLLPVNLVSFLSRKKHSSGRAFPLRQDSTAPPTRD